MKTILLTNHYSAKVSAIVRNQLPEGFELVQLEQVSREELAAKAHCADYFLASGRLPIDEEILTNAVNLKMIQRTGVGTDRIDLNALKSKGIPIYVNSGVNAVSVAEHTIMLILSVLRKLTSVDSRLKSGIWQKNDTAIECNMLSGKTVGLVGAGNIGKYVMKMLRPFETRIIYYDTVQMSKQDEQEHNAEYHKLADLLKEADILTLHCPINAHTEGLISAEAIASMKSGAIIINTARGKVIDEPALVEALKSDKLRGAGLDVFQSEPVNADNPLLKMDNVIATPHIAGLTFEAFVKMIRDAFENIKAFDEGRLDLLEGKRLI